MTTDIAGLPSQDPKDATHLLKDLVFRCSSSPLFLDTPHKDKKYLGPLSFQKNQREIALILPTRFPRVPKLVSLDCSIN